MEKFEYELIDLATIPRYEEMELQPIRPNYWKVIQFNFAIQLLIYASLLGLFLNLKSEELAHYFWIITIAFIFLMLLIYLALRIGFKKRSYGIRTHDLIYRNGILSTQTTIIPFNRIQHIAVNEGFLSRYYCLAQLQIFTAGGSSSDMKISGLLKEDAEKIKETILSKISTSESEHTQSLID